MQKNTAQIRVHKRRPIVLNRVWSLFFDFAFSLSTSKQNRKRKRGNKASVFGNELGCRHIELEPLQSKPIYLNGLK